MREGHRTRLHDQEREARVVMPTATAARSEDELLDTDVGRIFRLELDPVAVDMDRFVEVRSDEGRRRDVRRRRSESHGCERSDHHNSDGRGNPFLPAWYAHASP